jgi:hypothetical protein
MNAFNSNNIKFNVIVHEKYQTKLQPYGVFIRKSFYKNQMENTFKDNRVDKDHMSGVTALGMQIITLIVSEENIRDSIVTLLEENYTGDKDNLKKKSIITLLNYSENKDKKQTIADLIIHRFFQITERKEWNQKLDSLIPDWRKITLLIPKHPEEWCDMPYSLILVGLEILKQLNVSYKFKHVLGPFQSKKRFGRSIPNLEIVDLTRNWYKKELSQGSVLLNTELNEFTNNQIVYLQQVLNEGIIINDPYGIRLYNFDLKKKIPYIINNSIEKVSNRIEIKKNVKYFEHRLKFNPCMLKRLKNYVSEGKTEENNHILTENWGERNFFDWDEICEFKIGTWANIFY